MKINKGINVIVPVGKTITIKSGGTIIVDGGQFTSDSTFKSQSDATVKEEYGEIIIEQGAIIQCVNNGKLYYQSEYAFSNKGKFINCKYVRQYKHLNSKFFRFANNVYTLLQDLDITSVSELVIPDNETIKVPIEQTITVSGGGKMVVNYNSEVNGVISVQKDAQISVDADKTINVYGTISVSEGTIDVSGNINVKSNGLIEVQATGKIILKGSNKNFRIETNGVVKKGLFAYIGPDYNISNPEKIIKSCFPFDAIVSTPFGKKQCKDLNVGESVLVGYNNNQPVYEPILFFGHRENKETLFTELTLANGKKMSATPQHYIFTHNNRNKQIVHIKDVMVGDYVKYKNKRVKVTETNFVTKRGFISPHTKSHEIVINGVQASCYATEEFMVINNVAINIVDALGITIPLNVTNQLNKYIL